MPDSLIEDIHRQIARKFEIAQKLEMRSKNG